MTIVSSDTVVGLEFDAVRPSSRSRILQQLKQIASDQTVVFKKTTNINAPNSAGAQATAHNHGSTGGSILPIPLASYVLNLKLFEDSGLEDQGFQAATFVPFYVPLGISKVTLDLIFDNYESTSAFTFNAFNSSFGLIGSSLAFITTNSKIKGHARAFLDVNEGQVNILEVKARRSANNGYLGLKNICIHPNFPNFVKLANSDNSSFDDLLFPSTNQYAAQRFTSFDSSMFEDDMSVSSYLLASLSMNDNLLSEVISGHAVQDASSKTMTGHNHEGHSSDLDKSGAGIQHSLGSWNYGAALGATSAADNRHNEFDNIFPNYGNAWKGQKTGVTLQDNGALHTVAEHHFSFPATENSRIDGISTDIEASFCVVSNFSKSGILTIEASILTLDSATVGSIKTVTNSSSATARRILLTISNLTLPNSGLGGNGEGNYKLRVRIMQQNSVLGADSSFIYGTCLYLKG